MAAPQASARRADVKPLIIAAIVALVLGIAVAGLIVVATNGKQPTKVAPFAAGLETSIRADVRQGGPVFFADPFGGYRSVWFVLERNQLVPLAGHTWQDNHCAVRWRGSINRFVDCHGNRLTSDELPRYPSTVPTTGSTKGAVLVDVRSVLPPPALTATQATAAPAPSTAAP
ncbi:MAG TPA: hypothetical protein VIB48_17465 [Acidimicrobiia bacterium]|jgi:hypothetical protein